MNRRHFLQTMGYSTLAGIASSRAVSSNSSITPATKPRIAIFFEKEFPAIDTAITNIDALKQATEEFHTEFLSAREISDHLLTDKFDIYVNPYGSAFPKEAWPAILKFLIAGGNFANLGGTPFAVPVIRNGDSWRSEVEQTGYHKRLGITQSFPVKTTGVTKWQANEKIDWAAELTKRFTAEIVYEFYLRLTNSKNFPREDGSDGPREAIVHPLVSGIDADGISVAVPFLQIDRIKGDFAGGRWIFATSNGSLSASAIHSILNGASVGSNQFSVRTSFACYRDGEQVEVNIAYEGKEKFQTTCETNIYDSHNQLISSVSTRISNDGTTTSAVGQRVPAKDFKPGYYRVEAEMKIPDTSSSILRATSGFWIYDEKLLAAGGAISTGEYSFHRDGKPYPITGTTYMATDVHRQFLFEPNPYLWNRDFAEMKRNGINMVRTGIWTAWKNLMSYTGEVNQAALRGLDAFLLTARQYDIPVIFTFFAFLPEEWGGENPFLDPRSVANQKKFISTITQRYAQMNNVGWDLINEPSFCSASHLWSCRPNYDRFEIAAWNDWLKDKFSAANDQERESHLQELWRLSPDQSIGLPALGEFEDRNIFEKGSSLKVLEYRLFAQEMFARWTKEMTSAIRSNGNPHQLITVGQDEGGTFERPNNLFLSNEVDFTCNHTWWLNDDLVWDSVMTKVAGRPNLIEETGVMFYEKSDGRAWRTEEEARNLLERKLALAIGVSGSGFIEWIWNTNPYMPSDNEAAIGLLRADGSAKPEFKVVRDIAAFVEQAKPHFEDRAPEQVVLVVPHSNMFSIRNNATDATKRAVRVMHYHCRVPMRSVSEYHLAALKEPPPLLILPSPGILREDAWAALMSVVERGSTLIVTGPIDEDDHWISRDRLTDRLSYLTTPVAQEEQLIIDGAEYRLSYRSEKIQRIEKAVLGNSNINSVKRFQRGKGNILWCNLPVELSENSEATAVLYRYGLKLAGLSPSFTASPIDPSILIYPSMFKESMLYTLVSETSRDLAVKLTTSGLHNALDVNLKAQRAALLLLSNKDGRVICSYNAGSRT